MTRRLPVFALAVLAVGGCADSGDVTSSLPYERLTNAVFSAPPPRPDLPPRVTPVAIPAFPGAAAIWGATGRDDRGRVYFGVSAIDVPHPSARLFGYDPDADAVTELGDVLTELKRAGRLRPDEAQPKIHSKIYQAADGHLYFTSMDEPRYGEVGERPPAWGSHLWRVRLPERRWEHVLAVREGLIALAGSGNLIYALGFPEHTVYQYNIATGRSRSTVVGSFSGHVTRNIFADERGHVYVPRLRLVRPDHADHTLVELDATLREIQSFPLSPHYQRGAATTAHGITGVQHLADHSIAFVTHAGRLFRLRPGPPGRGSLEDLGWLHPQGESYAASLFTYAGSSEILGIGLRRPRQGQVHEWITYDLAGRHAASRPLVTPQPQSGQDSELLFIYGCETRDRHGDFYVAGADRRGGGWRPFVYRLRPAR